MPGPAATFAPLLGSGAIVRVFGLTVLGFASAFTIVAYLGPIINRLTGVTGAGVGALQAFIGVGHSLVSPSVESLQIARSSGLARWRLSHSWPSISALTRGPSVFLQRRSCSPSSLA